MGIAEHTFAARVKEKGINAALGFDAPPNVYMNFARRMMKSVGILTHHASQPDKICCLRIARGKADVRL